MPRAARVAIEPVPTERRRSQVAILTSVDELDYEQIVALYHHDLYRFAYSLAGNADDASELTQETYYRLLSNDRQLRDPTKIKAWLFTHAVSSVSRPETP